MANKRIIMSVTASAAIASAIFAAEEVDAATHKVQSGESLWKIAQQYGTSVSTLKSVNNLASDLIYPNQLIETTKKSTSSNNSNSGSSSKPAASGSTYTVKAGDTLSGIATRHKISLQNLMKWNNLDTTLIFPGNVFVVSKSGNSSGSGNSSSGSGNTTTKPQNTSVYTVKSGDTLSRIGSQHGVSVANLKKWNNLSSDLIRIGQKLNVNSSSSSSGSKPSASKPATNVGYDVNKLVSVAKGQTGVGYAWGGSSPSGFDCSGFIHYAYTNAGKSISRLSTDGYFDRSFYVDTPQVGDLVFFSGTYRAGISHMGIYIGNNQFIHAGSSTGVTVTSLNDSYWSKHFDSYKRFY